MPAADEPIALCRAARERPATPRPTTTPRPRSSRRARRERLDLLRCGPELPRCRRAPSGLSIGRSADRSSGPAGQRPPETRLAPGRAAQSRRRCTTSSPADGPDGDPFVFVGLRSGRGRPGPRRPGPGRASTTTPCTSPGAPAVERRARDSPGRCRTARPGPRRRCGVTDRPPFARRGHASSLRHERAVDEQPVRRLAVTPSALASRLALAVPPQPALEGGEDRVVVAARGLRAPRFSNSTRMIGLNASYSSMNVTRVRPSPRSVSARPAGRVRPQRLADRVVAPRLVRLHLGEPLPRLADAAGQQPLRHREVAVADESVPVVVARMQDLDARVDVLRLRTVGAAVPEDLPHVFRRRIQLDRELVALHERHHAARRWRHAAAAPDCARSSSQRQFSSKWRLPSVMMSYSHQNA